MRRVVDVVPAVTPPEFDLILVLLAAVFAAVLLLGLDLVEVDGVVEVEEGGGVAAEVRSALEHSWIFFLSVVGRRRMLTEII